MLPVYLVMALFAAASCRPQAPAAAAAAVTPAGVVRANRRIANVIKLLNKVDHSSLASRLTELHPVLANFSKRNVAASALFRQITSNLIARQQAAGGDSVVSMTNDNVWVNNSSEILELIVLFAEMSGHQDHLKELKELQEHIDPLKEKVELLAERIKHTKTAKVAADLETTANGAGKLIASQ